LEHTLAKLDGSPIKSSSLPPSPKSSSFRRLSLVHDYPMPCSLEEFAQQTSPRNIKKRSSVNKKKNLSSPNRDPRKRKIEAIITDRR
jgi:hypothetical protein